MIEKQSWKNNFLMRFSSDSARGTPQNGGTLPPCTGDGTGAGNFHQALEPYLRGEFPLCPVGPARNNLVAPDTAANPS
ncbi:MAG: hypothetical protein AAF223_16950, partial [Bacteroidota bacterium]